MDDQLETLRENAEHAGDIQSVIDRLAKAKEGGAELNLAIANIGVSPPWRWHDGIYEQCVIRDQYGAGAVGNPVCSLEYFTEKTDVALELVPGDWRVHSISQFYGKWSVCLHRAFGVEEDEAVWKKGHHWPSNLRADGAHGCLQVAICIAALQACMRAVGQSQQEKSS